MVAECAALGTGPSTKDTLGASQELISVSNKYTSLNQVNLMLGSSSSSLSSDSSSAPVAGPNPPNMTIFFPQRTAVCLSLGEGLIPDVDSFFHSTVSETLVYFDLFIIVHILNQHFR